MHSKYKFKRAVRNDELIRRTGFDYVCAGFIGSIANKRLFKLRLIDYWYGRLYSLSRYRGSRDKPDVKFHFYQLCNFAHHKTFNTARTDRKKLSVRRKSDRLVETKFNNGRNFLIFNKAFRTFFASITFYNKADEFGSTVIEFFCVDIFLHLCDWTPVEICKRISW